MTLSIDPKDTHVFLIGNSQFEDKQFSPLPTVKNNISELKNLFADKDIIGIDKNNIHPIVDKDCGSIILSEISDKLQEFLIFNTLIIYYAGHGVIDNKKLYLVTKQTNFIQPRANAIYISDLWEIITDQRISKPKYIILILDCCHSGMALENCTDYGTTYILTATDKILKAHAPPELSFTAFTEEFISILRSGINNGKSTLNLDEIYCVLKKQLPHKNRPKPSSSSKDGINKLEIANNLIGVPISKISPTIPPQIHEYEPSYFLHKKKKERWYFSYLMNYDKQEQEFRDLVQKYLDEDNKLRTYPLIFLQHGEEGFSTAHGLAHRFKEDLETYCLPKFENCTLEVSIYHFNCENLSKIKENIIDQAFKRRGKEPEEKFLAYFDKPVLFYSEIDIRQLNKSLLYKIFSFWQQESHQLSHNHLFLVCLFIRYPHSDRTISDRLKKSLLQWFWINKIANYNCLLTELEPISMSDAKNWVHDLNEKNYINSTQVQYLLKFIKEYFPENKKLRMEEIAERFQSELENLFKQQ